MSDWNFPEDYIPTSEFEEAERERLAALKAEVERLTAALARCKEVNRDWPRGSTADAVERVRAAAESDDDLVQVSPADLRKLFSSADGLADAYSQVIEEITGGMLTKPTTDPEAALSIARELESKYFEEFRVSLEEAVKGGGEGILE